MQHEEAAEKAGEGFNAGTVIIDHVSNSSIDHPLIHLPTVFGVNLSVTKHVLMLWLVAAVLFLVITTVVRRYLRQERMVPSGPMAAFEILIEFLRETVVQAEPGQQVGGRVYAAAAHALLLHPRART